MTGCIAASLSKCSARPDQRGGPRLCRPAFTIGQQEKLRAILAGFRFCLRDNWVGEDERRPTSGRLSRPSRNFNSPEVRERHRVSQSAPAAGHRPNIEQPIRPWV